jgi:hypothetical protein
MSRLFPLTGENQTTDSVRNENDLSIVKMLSQFDSCLYENIKKSVTICKEFIEIMGAHMLAYVVIETQISKNCSISVHSTPDVAQVDTFNLLFCNRPAGSAIVISNIHYSD